MPKTVESRKRPPLPERSSVTFSDIVARPDELYSPADLASAGLFGSYASYYRAVQAGKIPAPKRLPSGRLVQTGRAVLDALDLWPPDSGAQAA